MVFDSPLQLCDQWNTAYNRKKARTLLIILWRDHELLKGKESENYSSNVTVQMFTMSINSLK